MGNKTKKNKAGGENQNVVVPNQSSGLAMEGFESVAAKSSYFKYSLLLAEVLFAVMEFWMGMVMVKELHRFMIQGFFGVHLHEASTTIQVMESIMSTILLCSWLFWRTATIAGVTVYDFLNDRAGMFRFSLSKVALGLLLANFLGFLFMLYLQNDVYQRWIYTWENYYDSDNHLRISHLVDILVLAPIREEVMFRVFLFFTISRRISIHSPHCALVSGLVFGSIHLLNLLLVQYSVSYIILQVCLGSIIGTLYSLRFQNTSCIWEVLILHMANNIFSSFLPLDTEFDLNDPMIVFPLIETIVMYMVFVYFSWSSPPKQD